MFILFLKYSAESLFTAFFPAECRICGGLLQNISRLPVCTSCIDGVRPFHSPKCGICGELVFGAVAEKGGEVVCGTCERLHPSYERAVFFGPYEGNLRELVHLLKYRGMRSAEKPLGRCLADAMKEVLAEAGPDAIIVPVPLHTAKNRLRRFNQAELIARAALKLSGSRIRVADRVLIRTRATTSQTGLTQHQRRENIHGAFQVPKDRIAEVKGRTVILVDDVFTTGTTAEECSRVLLRAGAAKVYVATVARVSKLEPVVGFERWDPVRPASGIQLPV